MSVDVVIARHKEDIGWLQHFSNHNLFLYNKSNSEIESDLPNLNVLNVKNWGRESDTYLTHIIDNYHNLADVTLFLQGHPFDHCPYLLGIAGCQSISEIVYTSYQFHHPCSSTLYYNDNFVGIGSAWVNTQDGNNNWDRYCWYLPTMRVFKVLFNRGVLPSTVKAVWGAQFAATRECLHKFTLEQYQAIKHISDTEYYLPWGLEKYWPFIYSDNQIKNAVQPYYF